jgi:hypothetical protein
MAMLAGGARLDTLDRRYTLTRMSVTRMSVKLLRWFLVLLIVATYVGATSVVPMVYADATGMSSGMMHEQDGQSDTMPCKGIARGCVSELGCIFLVSMPAADLTVFTTAAWSSVTYSVASAALYGRTIKPALSPPILFV